MGRGYDGGCEVETEVRLCLAERTGDVWWCRRWQWVGRGQRWFEKSRAVVVWVCRAQSTVRHGSGVGHANVRRRADVAVLLLYQGSNVAVDHGSDGLAGGQAARMLYHQDEAGHATCSRRVR